MQQVQPLPTRTRRGFTILELIVVLAILLGLISLVVPPVRSLLRDQELRDISQNARSMAGRARLSAIKYGITIYTRKVTNSWTKCARQRRISGPLA